LDFSFLGGCEVLCAEIAEGSEAWDDEPRVSGSTAGRSVTLLPVARLVAGVGPSMLLFGVSAAVAIIAPGVRCGLRMQVLNPRRPSKADR
jgi:hypothetical protein